MFKVALIQFGAFTAIWLIAYFLLDINFDHWGVEQIIMAVLSVIIIAWPYIAGIYQKLK